MCGITAIFSRDSGVSDDIMAAGTAALHHRGPDGQKHWISPDQRVGLGHARLRCDASWMSSSRTIKYRAAC